MEARDLLRRSVSLLPLGKTETLQVKTVERFGFTLAEVISSITINLAMVNGGQAFAYASPWAGVMPGGSLDAGSMASKRRYCRGLGFRPMQFNPVELPGSSSWR